MSDTETTRDPAQPAATCRCGHSRDFHGGECMHVEYDDGTDLWCPCLAFDPVEMGRVLAFKPDLITSARCPSTTETQTAPTSDGRRNDSEGNEL